MVFCASHGSSPPTTVAATGPVRAVVSPSGLAWARARCRASDVRRGRREAAHMQCLIKMLSLHSWCLWCFVPAMAPHRRPQLRLLVLCVPWLALVGWPGLAPAAELPMSEGGDMADVLRYFTVLCWFSFYTT